MSDELGGEWVDAKIAGAVGGLKVLGIQMRRDVESQWNRPWPKLST